MKNQHPKIFLNFTICFIMLLSIKQSYSQTPGTMEFGSSTSVLANTTNPDVDQSSSSLLNGFDMSATGVDIILAFAESGNGSGTDAIGGSGDAVLCWIGDGADAISNGTLSTDSGGDIGLTSMTFAYERAIAGPVIDFTISGKRDGTEVGTIALTSPTHNSAININFTLPTTGSFTSIDELVITPASSLFGGFSIDDLVVVTASTLNSTYKNISNVAIFKSSKSEITISGLETNAELTIYSMLGKKLISKKVNFNGYNKVNLPSFNHGLYIINIKSELGIISKKMFL